MERTLEPTSRTPAQPTAVLGAALMWAWWDLAVYTAIFRNWMSEPLGFSESLFIVTMVSASVFLFAFARRSPWAASWMYSDTPVLTCIGMASIIASVASIVGAWAHIWILECAAGIVGGAVLAVMLALWGTVAAERGSRSAIVNTSLGIVAGAVIDAIVLYALRPFYAAVAVALFPCASILVYVLVVRKRLDDGLFGRGCGACAPFKKVPGAERREAYGVSIVFLAGLGIAEIAFNYMNYQIVYAPGDPVDGVAFNYACHVARALGALACYVFVEVVGIPYRRFFWVGGLLMAFAFATMPFWGMAGIPPHVSNYINMACFAMVVVFVFGVLAEISYSRDIVAIEPMCIGAIFVTGVDVFGILLGAAVNCLAGNNPSAVATFTSALGYILILALLATLSEGQRHLEPTGAERDAVARWDDGKFAAHEEMLRRRQALVEKAGLTPRERDVLDELVGDAGLLSAAHALGVSENTLKTHVQSIYRKFGVHGRAELIALLYPAANESGGEADAQRDAAGQRKPAYMDAIDRLSAAHGLTPRETEIFALLAKGYRHGEIKQRLSVSASTVHTHVSNIYAKLGVHTQPELGRLVREARDDAERTDAQQT